jgi:hypothetical protein
MKRLFFAVMFLAAALPANAQMTKAEEKKVKEISAKAGALKIEKCELNDGKKGWIMPNRDPIGDLAVYRCTAEDSFGEATAIYTQIPDGSVTKEVVEFCTFSDYHTKCESVPADRPARRTGDLAKYGVTARQFEPITCESTSVGTLGMSMCSKPREKQQPGLLGKLLGK